MRSSQKGFSTIEIVMVFTIILAVLIGFGGYIKRSLAGRWKNTGDALGQGRQYDPRGFGVAGEHGGTLDCFFDRSTGHWVVEQCYQANNCDCTLITGTGVELPEYATECVACKQRCWNDAQCN